MELIINVIAALALFGSIVTWGYVLARLRAERPILDVEPRPPVPWTPLDLVLIVLALLLSSAVGELVLRQVLGVPLPLRLEDLDEQAFIHRQFVSATTTFATLVFAGVLLVVRHSVSVADLGFTTRKLGHDLKLGLYGFVAIAPPVLLLQALLVYLFPGQHPLIEILKQFHSEAAFVVAGISVSIVAPLGEELLFRVLLQGWLEKKFPPVMWMPMRNGGQSEVNDQALDHAAEQREPRKFDAIQPSPLPILISSLVFALMHMGQGPSPVPLFFLALALGYLYQRTHRIWPSLVVHFLLNTWSLVVLWTHVQAGE